MNLEARIIGKGQEGLLAKGLEVLHANRPELNDSNAPDDLTTVDSVIGDITKRNKGEKETVVVVGTDLDDPEKAKVAGYLNVILFRPSGTAAIVYLETAPEMKGQNIERSLVDLARKQIDRVARVEGVPLKAVFTELEDPSLYTDPKDIKNAQGAIDFCKGNGIKAVEVGQALAGQELDYRQPWWYKEDGLLRLYTIPDQQGNIATPADVKGFYDDLHAFHSTPKLNSRKGYSAARAITEAGIVDMKLAYDNRVSANQGPPRVDMSNDGPAPTI